MNSTGDASWEISLHSLLAVADPLRAMLLLPGRDS
jgi:hypothetical protein